VDSTDEALDQLQPAELSAARGQLPTWARTTLTRRAHIARVAALMETWARALDVGDTEVLRWAAAAWLHDSLRDEDPEVLRPNVSPEERDLPGPVLHGPAAAAHLKGQVDPRVAAAVRYHTIGHPSLDRLGRALYLADFLEPGREFAVDWRASLTARMPHDLDDVLVEVVAARVGHLLERRNPIRPETAAFWSAIVSEGRR
jgi:2-amino-4-hydroxy-6-hydroxymethyldihydropteridine diphosphokinase